MPARINLFAPLPPLMSEVGNHTVLVARALAELADVTLWTPQAEPPDAVPDIPIVRYDPAAIDWPRLHRADANVYNIGNNATFHRAIFDVAAKVPGIVVLHDTRLQHFFAGYTDTGPAGTAFYLDEMRRIHGPGARADAERWLAGHEALDTLVMQYPMTAATLSRALAAIVHNGAERPALAAETRMPVHHLPLACDAGPRPVRRPHDGTIRLIMFGFLGVNRRIAEVLGALAAAPDQRVRLDIFGVMQQAPEIHDLIARLRLTDRVTCHGYVPEPALRGALLQADLALNLRFPSMGEASASQLRIWAAGLPSIVTRIGWYAALPQDAVFFAGPENEADHLAMHLAAFRADPIPYRQAGLRGRDIVTSRHAPEAYARSLLDIVRQIPVLHARQAAIDLSRLASRTLMSLSGPGSVGLCAAEVAAAIQGLSWPDIRT